MAPARAHQLRQGPARPGCARLARHCADPVSRRAGRRPRVSALELAQAALAAADEAIAEAVVLAESSGLARFARSEVHQPTLVENVVVNLRVVRDGAVGTAITNRIDDDGFGELARRARAAAETAHPDPRFAGLAAPGELPAVGGWDEELAALGPADQARFAAEAIAAAGDDALLYGFRSEEHTSELQS